MFFSKDVITIFFAKYTCPTFKIRYLNINVASFYYLTNADYYEPKLQEETGWIIPAPADQPEI